MQRVQVKLGFTPSLPDTRAYWAIPSSQHDYDLDNVFKKQNKRQLQKELYYFPPALSLQSEVTVAQ